MGKVLLIGGSPMIGKSTVAKKISAMYELQNISTDDVGEILQTVVDINPMKNLSYLDYYEKTELNTLIEDMGEYHKVISKAISKIIDIHSKWGGLIVIEGYAIYPNKSIYDNVEAIWLIADEKLLTDRMQTSPSFANASANAKNKYLERSLWHNDYILQECKKYNRKYIKVNGEESAEEIAKKIIEILEFSF